MKTRNKLIGIMNGSVKHFEVLSYHKIYVSCSSLFSHLWSHTRSDL